MFPARFIFVSFSFFLGCLIGSPDLSSSSIRGNGNFFRTLPLLNPLIQLCSQHGQNYSALFRVANYSPCKGGDVISVENFFNLRRGNRYSHSHSRARCSRSRKQAHSWPRCSRCRHGTRRGRSPRLNITPFVSGYRFSTSCRTSVFRFSCFLLPSVFASGLQCSSPLKAPSFSGRFMLLPADRSQRRGNR